MAAAARGPVPAAAQGPFSCPTGHLCVQLGGGQVDCGNAAARAPPPHPTPPHPTPRRARVAKLLVAAPKARNPPTQAPSISPPPFCGLTLGGDAPGLIGGTPVAPHEVARYPVAWPHLAFLRLHKKPIETKTIRAFNTVCAAVKPILFTRLHVRCTPMARTCRHASEIKKITRRTLFILFCHSLSDRNAGQCSTTTCTGAREHAASTPPARRQHAASTRSACGQHVASTPPARRRHAVSTWSARGQCSATTCTRAAQPID